MKQPFLTLNPISGIEWLVRKMISEVADTAVVVSELTRGADSWVEWMEEEEKEQESKRSSKEERWLWHRLGECDKEQARVEKLNNWKKGQKIARARQRMGGSRNQPGIMESVDKRVAQTSSSSCEVVAKGGPCHHIGGGAPPQQINTRARDQAEGSSLQSIQGSAHEEIRHTDCTPVRANNFCTGAVDWARVGGVVHESVGVCMNDREL